MIIPLHWILQNRIVFAAAFACVAFSHGAAPTFARPQGTKRIEITFRKNGEGTMNCVGLGQFPCLGQSGRGYPTDLTVTEADKESLHKSVEFNADMPFAVRIWGQKGIYIHEGADNLKANEDPSAGCIHLDPGNAKKVYDWIDGRARITIMYPWQTTIP